jgi:endonuclease I
VPPEALADHLARTHGPRPTYKPAREVYPWVDLQPDGTIRSLYTGQVWDPEALIRADVEVAAARTRTFTARLARPGVQDADHLTAEIEAELPFNCEHVVPQSWFAKREPMRGDLHHLFACESRCNSFRSNTPYTEFADFPEPPSAGPGMLVVRSDCGKSESNGFEPAHGKGAAARAVLYFLMRYPGVVEEHEMPGERRALLLAWHEGDPVGEWERHRNAAIFERQGNRNPFIDDAALARTFLSTFP